jgi:hypothetical protein
MKRRERHCWDDSGTNPVRNRKQTEGKGELVIHNQSFAIAREGTPRVALLRQD